MKESIGEMMLYGCVSALVALTACGGDTGPTSFGTSTLVIQMNTIGSLPDPDGYLVSIDDGGAMTVTDNGTLIIQSLAAGPHRVHVGGLSANCATPGDSSQVVRASTEGYFGITFTVACYDPRIQGALKVIVHGGFAAGGNGPFLLLVDGQSAGSLRSVPPDTADIQLAAGLHAVELKWKIDCGPINSGPLRAIVPENGTSVIAFEIACD